MSTATLNRRNTVKYLFQLFRAEIGDMAEYAAMANGLLALYGVEFKGTDDIADLSDDADVEAEFYEAINSVANFNSLENFTAVCNAYLDI